MTNFLKSILFLSVATGMLSPKIISNTNYYSKEPDVKKSYELNKDELTKIADGVNIIEEVDPKSMGSKEGKIFDYNNPEFASLFSSTSFAKQKTNSESGRSRSEITKKIGENAGININSGLTMNYPNIVNVNTNIASSFDMSKRSELDRIVDEYYEYYQVSKFNKVVTVDWLTRKNLQSYFNPTFLEEYSNIKNVIDAKKFLTKYGTHVFNRYYFGGTLFMSKYVCSESNISETYKESGFELSLSTSIKGAMNAADAESSGYASNIEGQSVNTNDTKSTTFLDGIGGKYLDGITIDNLFTYNGDWATAYGSGYVYRTWLRSIDDGNNLSIVNVENPISIWELIEKTESNDTNTNELLKKAFDLLYFSRYSSSCKANDVDSDLIESISYKEAENDNTIEFNPKGDSIILPASSSVEFVYSDYINKNLELSKLKLELEVNYPYARIVDSADGTKQTLVLDKSANFNKFNLLIKYDGETIHTINITCKKGKFRKGYGTKEQPYVISELIDWNQFVGNKEYLTSNYYYEMDRDIDFKGKALEPIGTAANRSIFKGVFDGNNHTIKNATIISKNNWNNIGLFAYNNGWIKNLTLENIRVLNDAVLKVSNGGQINVGILAGTNNNRIENCWVKNSSIYFTSYQHDSKDKTNIGAIAGLNNRDIMMSTVSNCSLRNQTYYSAGESNTGCVVGKNNHGFIENVCSYLNKLYFNEIQNYKKRINNIGDVVGNSIKSEYSFIVSYDNEIDYVKDNTNNFGFICGNSDKDSVFYNCYFESSKNISVNDKNHDGCRNLSQINMDYISNAEMNDNWVDSYDLHKPVLKIHNIKGEENENVK